MRMYFIQMILLFYRKHRKHNIKFVLTVLFYYVIVQVLRHSSYSI